LNVASAIRLPGTWPIVWHPPSVTAAADKVARSKKWRKTTLPWLRSNHRNGPVLFWLRENQADAKTPATRSASISSVIAARAFVSAIVPPVGSAGGSARCQPSR
jgi:hypothetical protein